MLCAISGEAPEEPVVSKKSGAVFEKRLIEKYVEENGKDPVSGEELDLEDLLPIRSARTVRPRPPTLTSIPALLSQFQNEWDSLAIETYNLREQLARTREELATALYQHDAAVRVIARLTKERDQARSALARIGEEHSNSDSWESVHTLNDDAKMAAYPEPVPKYAGEIMNKTLQKLSTLRRKRTISDDWSTPDDVATFQLARKSDSTVTEASALAMAPFFSVVAGRTGGIAVYTNESGSMAHHFDAECPITQVTTHGLHIVVGTATGEVRVLKTDGTELARWAKHTAPVVGLAMHPSSQFVVSVSQDRSYVYYDLFSSRAVYQGFIDADPTTCAIHPDGNLFAVGTRDGKIRVYGLVEGKELAWYEYGPEQPISTITFSENGYWFLAGSNATPRVAIYDLRKKDSPMVGELVVNGDVRCLELDRSGLFLAIATSTNVMVYHYLKSEKRWQEVLEYKEQAQALHWGDKAKSLVILDDQGGLSMAGSKPWSA